ncbi:hypothetical protein Plhal304r1_c052g0136261 [Plasmopara halstedii]
MLHSLVDNESTQLAECKCQIRHGSGREIHEHAQCSPVVKAGVKVVVLRSWCEFRGGLYGVPTLVRSANAELVQHVLCIFLLAGEPTFFGLGHFDTQKLSQPPVILQAIRLVELSKQPVLALLIMHGTNHVVHVDQLQHELLSVDQVIETGFRSTPLKSAVQKSPIDLRVPFTAGLTQAIQRLPHYVDIRRVLTRKPIDPIDIRSDLKRCI